MPNEYVRYFSSYQATQSIDENYSYYVYIAVNPNNSRTVKLVKLNNQTANSTEVDIVTTTNQRPNTSVAVDSSGTAYVLVGDSGQTKLYWVSDWTSKTVSSTVVFTDKNLLPYLWYDEAANVLLACASNSNTNTSRLAKIDPQTKAVTLICSNVQGSGSAAATYGGFGVFIAGDSNSENSSFRLYKLNLNSAQPIVFWTSSTISGYAHYISLTAASVGSTPADVFISYSFPLSRLKSKIFSCRYTDSAPESFETGFDVLSVDLLRYGNHLLRIENSSQEVVVRFLTKNVEPIVVQSQNLFGGNFRHFSINSGILKRFERQENTTNYSITQIDLSDFLSFYSTRFIGSVYSKGLTTTVVEFFGASTPSTSAFSLTQGSNSIAISSISRSGNRLILTHQSLSLDSPATLKYIPTDESVEFQPFVYLGQGLLPAKGQAVARILNFIFIAAVDPQSGNGKVYSFNKATLGIANRSYSGVGNEELLSISPDSISGELIVSAKSGNSINIEKLDTSLSVSSSAVLTTPVPGLEKAKIVMTADGSRTLVFAEFSDKSVRSHIADTSSNKSASAIATGSWVVLMQNSSLEDVDLTLGGHPVVALSLVNSANEKIGVASVKFNPTSNSWYGAMDDEPALSLPLNFTSPLNYWITKEKINGVIIGFNNNVPIYIIGESGNEYAYFWNYNTRSWNKLLLSFNSNEYSGNYIQDASGNTLIIKDDSLDTPMISVLGLIDNQLGYKKITLTKESAIKRCAAIRDGTVVWLAVTLEDFDGYHTMLTKLSIASLYPDVFTEEIEQQADFSVDPSSLTIVPFRVLNLENAVSFTSNSVRIPKLIASFSDWFTSSNTTGKTIAISQIPILDESGVVLDRFEVLNGIRIAEIEVDLSSLPVEIIIEQNSDYKKILRFENINNQIVVRLIAYHGGVG